MKVTTDLIFKILVFVSCVSCNEVNTLNAYVEKDYIKWDSLIEINQLEEVVDTINCIKLQTTENSLMGHVVKLEVDDKYLFIKDSNQKLFVFGIDGSFIRNIGKIGNGPDELLGLFDFYLDKVNKCVNVIDIFRASIFQYTYNGKLINTIKLSNELLRGCGKFFYISDDCVLATKDNSKSSVYNYSVLNVKEKKISHLLRYMITGDLTMSFNQQNKVCHFNDSLYLTSFFSDTIHAYQKDKLAAEAKWIFKGPNKNSNIEYFKNRQYELGIEAERTARENGVSTGITNLHMVNNYIYFTHSCENSIYACFYNKNKGNGYRLKIENENRLLENIITTDNECFICCIPIYELDNINLKTNSKLENILSDSQDDDNPILVCFNVK
ncbi:MAG: 6-bladed beta-propeller [Bacteroidaceae bacterium]|nr:6-bladed beta-propeller [Bacteroidaceae bacterium]MBR3895580.1 6-bladed beta-propeller [Bacteroidaceae bacterium]